MPQLHFLSEASELSHISKLCALMLMCTMIAYILCHWGIDRKKQTYYGVTYYTGYCYEDLGIWAFLS